MRILLVDDEKAFLDGFKIKLERFNHKVITHSSGVEALAIPNSELDEIDVAILDQQMPELDGLETGKGLIEKSRGIILIMLTAYGSIEQAVRAIRDYDFFDYLEKPVDQLDLEAALLRAKVLVDERHKTKRLRQELNSNQKIADAPYKLLDCTRHLVGIDDVLYQVAQTVNSFFWWKEGEYDGLPDELQPLLKPDFTTCLLFEGEPGSGKSELCRAIANAFDSKDTIFPRNLSPSKNPGTWKSQLDGLVKRFYLQAVSERCVIVIQVDDLVWPKVVSIGDTGLAADWINYMNTLRSYIEDAELINKGRQPQYHEELKSIRTFEGKILWLFARNLTEDVGEMYSPLRDIMTAFPLQFPRESKIRRRMLCMRALERGCAFDQDALDLARGELSDYNGRELIGGSTHKGFLGFIIRRIHEREIRGLKAAERNDQYKLDMTMTADIVREWINSPEHKNIMAQIAARSSEDIRPEGFTAKAQFLTDTGKVDLHESSIPQKLYYDSFDDVRATFDLFERGMAEDKKIQDIAKLKYSGGNARQQFGGLWKQDKPIQAFQHTPKDDAKKRWPHLLNYLMKKRRTILAKFDYPDYVKNWK
jgi:FixJ family two-component response regulator